ncbi:18223_t:CDS:2 [Dentiscutata erythropus]|uniref:18223_t:CDS:1 n=1 Tax=Dentiscutata erythropus TaxID=1348616 RepID=A0A9N9DQB5_9GLOM|nr:18223_t:CDS:2 [Dentiscutata erythropus]
MNSNLIVRQFIPNDNTVLTIYWTFTIAIIITSLILSILKGYFQMVDKESLFNIIQSTILIEYCIAYMLGGLCFIKYGRLVVKLLDESTKIMGLEDIRISESKALRLQSYRTHLNKLKVMNFSLSVIVCWLAVMAFFVALFRSKIAEYLPLYITLAIISFDGTAIINLTALFGIVYGEVHKQNSAVAEEVTTSINYSTTND